MGIQFDHEVVDAPSKPILLTGLSIYGIQTAGETALVPAVTPLTAVTVRSASYSRELWLVLGSLLRSSVVDRIVHRRVRYCERDDGLDWFYSLVDTCSYTSPWLRRCPVNTLRCIVGSSNLVEGEMRPASSTLI